VILRVVSIWVGRVRLESISSQPIFGQIRSPCQNKQFCKKFRVGYGSGLVNSDFGSTLGEHISNVGSSMSRIIWFEFWVSQFFQVYSHIPAIFNSHHQYHILTTIITMCSITTSESLHLNISIAPFESIITIHIVSESRVEMKKEKQA